MNNKKKIFIGIVKNDKVKDYCLKNKCILDIWDLSKDKYRDVKEGDTGFIYDATTDTLFGVYKAKDEAKEFPDTPFKFSKVSLDLKIELESVEDKEIGDARRTLEKYGLKFDAKTECPEPRVYDIDEETYNELLKGGPSAESSISLQEIPISFEDVVGFKKLKDMINLLKKASNDPDAKKYNIRICRGFFLFGPPGTGKTHFAQAVASELEVEYAEIHPSIIQGFPGEGEGKIKKVLQELFKEESSVIIFDEADALFPRREANYMTGTMARIVPTFLMEIDHLLKNEAYQNSPIFLFAISNHPESIDDAFLRPGRFDNPFYVPLPTEDECMELFKRYLKNKPTRLDNDGLNKVKEELIKRSAEIREEELSKREKEKGDNSPELHKDYGKFSPADIKCIVNSAALKAYERKEPISAEIIIEVIKESVPSVINKILWENEKFMAEHPNSQKCV